MSGDLVKLQEAAQSREKELKNISGAHHLHYEVDWKSFTPEALYYLDNVGFFRLEMAYRGSATDDTGKHCLHRITHIKVKNAPGKPGHAVINHHTLEMEGDYAKGLDGAVSNMDLERLLNKELKIKHHRLLKKLKEEQIPARDKEAKTDIDIDVKFIPDYDSLKTENAIEFYDNICCLRVLMALRTIRDVYGKENAAKVKTIAHKHSSSRAMKFDGASGALMIEQAIDRDGATQEYFSNNEIFALIEETLGLKALKQLATLKKQIVDRTKEVQEILGVPIEYVVDYNSFKTDQELLYVDNVTCHRVNMAFRCLDSATKDFLQKHLKRISIQCVPSEAAKTCTYKDNGAELALVCAYAFALSGAFSDNDILAEIKAKAK